MKLDMCVPHYAEKGALETTRIALHVVVFSAQHHFQNVTMTVTMTIAVV